MITLKDLEENYKLKLVKSKLAKDENEAAILADEIGFPVALKIDSEDILHKSDIGGVELNLFSKEEVKKAFNKIISSSKESVPSANINGVLVQEMLLYGFELIAGYKNDPVFGPSIMIGMGGIYTEIFQDIIFRLLPVSKEDIDDMISSLKFFKILFEGYRNIQSVSKDMLIDTVYKISNMAIDLSPTVDSFDINPLFVWGDQYRVVDFKLVLSKTTNSFDEEVPDTNNIDRFFTPSSVALVGASPVSDRIGNIILDNLINHGFKGKIYPVNPKYDSILNIRTYPAISDIQDRIDVAIITVSLSEIPSILEQCKNKNISNVIIISAGGKEIGNFELEEKIKKTASDYKIRIIGCNCLGIFDGFTRIDTLFQPYENMRRPKDGSISFITQSGTVGIILLELLGNYGLGKFISYGNRIDIDEGDLIKYLADDPKTRVIAVYIEGLEKGKKFFNSVKEASKKKPVVVYKAGRSPRASEATTSHTGFLSGTHSVIKGAMDQANAISVDSIEGLMASAKILSIYPRARGNRAIIITNGAGVAVQSIDRIIEKDKIKLAELSASSRKILKNELPGHVVIGNPIDLTGTATDKEYETVIKTIIQDSNVDIILVWFVFQCKPITPNIASILKNLYLSNNMKPIICGTMGENHTHLMGGLIEKENLAVFYSIEEWISAAEAISQ